MKKRKQPPLARKYIIRNVLILVLSILVLVAGSGCIYVDSLIGHGNFVDGSEGTSMPITPSTIDSGTTFNSAGANQINGMLKDEAITNILVLGIDDYQKDDPIGRSDSMMIISLDNRHKKLKLTSFMRDIYLAIPDHGSNKINAAYHFGAYDAVKDGKAKAGDLVSVNAGAQLCIKTVELNFGMNIDRYVVVKNSAFDDVIGILGGVDVNLTAKEAALINKNSGAGATLKLKNGVQHLDGAQAHYYGRIRQEGFDQYGNNITVPNVYGHYGDRGRAERQRAVVTSLVDKFKVSNLATISKLASGILPKVITNFTRNEIYSLLPQSLTMMNYPIKQNQIPAEGNYTTPNIDIGGTPASVVQITDNQKVVKDALTFIYEGDKPDVSHIGLAVSSRAGTSSNGNINSIDSNSVSSDASSEYQTDTDTTGTGDSNVNSTENDSGN
ncbi:MAG: LCP family protein [Oscillospiraceae bacterium]|nr:LCP family protein [Oscillospiraceae bacterium]